MSERGVLPNWVGQRARAAGPPDRDVRFEVAAKAIATSILRNRPISEGGSGCPVVVEGLNDEKSLRALGFSGTIEKVNRGWDRARLVAHLHTTYCSSRPPDGGPSLILLMDWDRTGGKLQTSLRDRLMALDAPIDEDLRMILLRAMKPEGRTVESLLPHSQFLEPIIQGELDEIG
jgi:5S rRNA maturation endonuclease (ribonuclease M5)